MEIVFDQESMYFVAVILFVNDNCSFSFIGLCDHRDVLIDFVVAVLFKVYLFLVCDIIIIVGVVQLFEFFGH